MFYRSIVPFATYSRIKWCLTSICFVRWWNSGFSAKFNEPWLSLYRRTDLISASAIEFRKALTTSICSISKSNRAARATTSFYITLLHTPANVWLKSFPYYYLSPLTTYLAFCFRILPSLSLLVFRISFPGSTLMPFRSFDCLKSF